MESMILERFIFLDGVRWRHIRALDKSGRGGGGESGIVNSLTTEKQTTKFSSANFQKMLSPSYSILRIQRLEGKQCRSR